MVRPTRTHVPGGIYYALLRSSGRVVLLSDENERTEFESLLQRALRGCRARIHAFCWTEHELHMAVQVSDTPLGKVVQRVTGQYAFQALKNRGESGHLFLHPYRAAILDDSRLLDLVRHIHRTPLTAEMNGDAAAYAWSSHRCYLGLDSIPWLTTSTVMRMCGNRARNPLEEYRRLISGNDSPVLTGLKHDAVAAAKVDGISYLHWLTDQSRVRRSTLSLTELAHAVAVRLEVDLVDMLSSSRQRKLSLARALTAWHATRNEIASLSSVARYFNRDPSTMISGIARYREERHTLFAEELSKMIRRNAQAATLKRNVASKPTTGDSSRVR